MAWKHYGARTRWNVRINDHTAGIKPAHIIFTGPGTISLGFPLVFHPCLWYHCPTIGKLGLAAIVIIIVILVVLLLVVIVALVVCRDSLDPYLGVP